MVAVAGCALERRYGDTIPTDVRGWHSYVFEMARSVHTLTPRLLMKSAGNWSVVLVLALLCTGCGGAPDRPKLAAVTGTVNFKGQPLAKGEVVFYPAKGRSARGDIENGQIVNVSTFDPGDGAPLGDLQVAVFSTQLDLSDPAGMATKSLIPAKYNDPAKSTLQISVKEGGPNTGEFNLTE